MVFFWLLIYKRDHLTDLGAGALGSIPICKLESSEGDRCIWARPSTQGSRGHGFLPRRPGSPETAVPTVGATLKAELRRNPRVASDLYIQPASLEEVNVICEACMWCLYPEHETTWPTVSTHSVSPAVL